MTGGLLATGAAAIAMTGLGGGIANAAPDEDSNAVPLPAPGQMLPIGAVSGILPVGK